MSDHYEMKISNLENRLEYYHRKIEYKRKMVNEILDRKDRVYDNLLSDYMKLKSELKNADIRESHLKLHLDALVGQLKLAVDAIESELKRCGGTVPILSRVLKEIKGE